MFFDNYCRLCEDKGYSPTGAALELGISRGTVSAWKNTGRLPQAAQLRKIAEFFGVSTDFLLQVYSKEHEEGDELQIYLNELKQREDMRILFSLAKGATKEEVMQAVKIIEALKKK